MDAAQQSLTKHQAAQYFAALGALLQQIDLDAVAGIAQRLRQARDAGATIFVAGNGGSAATASHWVNDLGKAAKQSGCVPLRVMSLHDNVPWLTALANDEGYPRVFAGQLENFARPGDVLVVLSASGNSANLIEAVDLASRREMSTVALLGFDGGVLRGRVSHCLWIPTEKGAYGLVEDAHAAVCHALTAALAGDPSPSRLAFQESLSASL